LFGAERDLDAAADLEPGTATSVQVVPVGMVVATDDAARAPGVLEVWSSAKRPEEGMAL
jgi:hypothetical protein